MGDLITKKGKKKESTAPVLSVLEATVRIHDPVYRAVGDTIAKNDGTTFTVEKPHISCQLELVDAGRANKKHIGTTWYEGSTTWRPQRAPGSSRTVPPPR